MLLIAWVRTIGLHTPQPSLELQRFSWPHASTLLGRLAREVAQKRLHAKQLPDLYRGVKHFVDRHEMGLFEIKETLEITARA